MTHLIRICAADEASLVDEISRTISFIDRVPEVRFDDVAYTCSFTAGRARLAVIASDTANMRRKLSLALQQMTSPTFKGTLSNKSGVYYFRDPLLGPEGGKLAFVFTSVLAFYPNMMRDLVLSSRLFRNAFDELEVALVSEDGAFTPSNFIFPPAPCYRHDAAVFKSGGYAQAFISIYTACNGLGRVLMEDGVSPDGVVGFGGGDLAALMLSVGLGEKPDRSLRVRILQEMYKMVSKSVDHSRAARVSLVIAIMRHAGDADKVVAAFPPGKCSLVVDFSPKQHTYAIEPDFESEALAAFAAAGIKTVPLDFDYPFNTPKCGELVTEIKKFLSKRMIKPPQCDYYSCATAALLSSKLRQARSEAAEVWSRPVEFRRTVEKMYEDGYRVFLEVGPRGFMTSAVEDTLKGREFAAMAMNSTHRTGRQQALHAIGRLAALGGEVDISRWFPDSAKRINFDSVLALEVRNDDVMRLSRRLPKMTLLGEDSFFGAQSPLSSPQGRGARAAQRAAVQERRQRQFVSGARNPLLSDAEKREESPGLVVEIRKTFRFSDYPFMSDFALGTSQLSYSDPNLRGLVILMPSVVMEMMAELAQMVVPDAAVLAISDFVNYKWIGFSDGQITLVLRAERLANSGVGRACVKVVVREDVPGGGYVRPVSLATVMMGSREDGLSEAAVVRPLARPRNVHWSGRDIYPARICYGRRLRGIRFVEAWGEEGVDYEVEVPALAGSVAYTRFPIWAVDPLLLGIVTSGYSIWRSHEQFAGAFSFPFRVRKLSVLGPLPKEGAKLKCYMRLTGVTPRSHICDILVSDGNGVSLMKIEGWEEHAERAPSEFRDMIMQPASGYLTSPLAPAYVGDPKTDIATAYVTDPPYKVFERYQKVWMHAISKVVLSANEQRDFDCIADIHDVPRATEWLYGRIAAKEAVRRFLSDFYQARWSDADITIYKDELGKPKATGDWKDTLTADLDIGIAHTARFIVAVAAANAKVGVDVEFASRDISDEFAAGAFSDSERDLAAAAAQSSQALIRFWCSKEAVSKALGTGLRYSPKDIVVTGYHPDTGEVTIRLMRSWIDAFKAFKGRNIVVSTRILREHALAFCFIPSSLLPEGSDFGDTIHRLP